MAHCQFCGTWSETGYCPNCGAPMPAAQQPAYQPSPTYQQPSQPPPVYLQQPYYPPQGPAQALHTPPPQKPGPSMKLFAIIIVAVVVIAAVGGAILFFIILKSPIFNPFGNAQEISKGSVIEKSFDQSGADHFYKIKLQPGDLLSATLTGAAGTDYDLYVYRYTLFTDSDIIGSSQNQSSTESVNVVAWESAYYVVDVYSYSGTGGYRLSVDVPKTVSIDDGNNDRDSAAPVSSGQTISQEANEYYDQDDYFKVQAGANGVVSALLKVPQGSDFDLYLYDSGGSKLAASENYYGNDEVKTQVSSAGSYYLKVHAYKGIGSYMLTVTVGDSTPTDSDNSLSAATSLAPPKTVTSTLDEFSDPDDYYSLPLQSGQTLSASLSGPASADFDLWLYDSGGNALKDYSSAGYSSTEQITFPVTTAGTYYVNPYAYSGSGTYSLSVSTSGSSGGPVANAGGDKEGEAGATISFDGSRSVGTGLTYSWEFGDSQSGTGATATHSYTAAGTYAVKLTVTDSQSRTDVDSATVKVFAAGARPNKYAVVVGISDYQTINDLSYCHLDAQSWKGYLENKGYTVHLLIDSQGTEAGIMSEIEWMKGQETPTSYCAFVFSGHGGLDTHKRESYLDTYEISSGGSGFLYDSELAAAFQGFESKHIFIFFDSCHSGGMDSSAGEGRYLSETCSKETFGLDISRYSHGLWTYWFLEWGLKSQGYEDLRTCFSEASKKVAADPSAQYTEGGRMTPEQEYGGSVPFYL
ncbi:MAG: PKD domain-containing protein [Euryarchaeota archaeon]|nr:PKD domain-containing protein [Euryarchaeota archaeon]